MKNVVKFELTRGRGDCRMSRGLDDKTLSITCVELVSTLIIGCIVYVCNIRGHMISGAIV